MTQTAGSWFERLRKRAPARLREWMSQHQRRIRVAIEAELPGARSATPLAYPDRPLRGVDVFAGAGLMNLGFYVEGINVEAVVEFDKAAVATLQRNLHPDSVVTDANSWVCPPDLDVLFGGPPCQPYSRAGKKQGELDPRDMLHHMVRWAREGRPRVICMENVANLLSKKFAPYLEELLARMDAVGYQTVFWKVKASDYGSPQGRERVFVVSWPKRAPWGPALQETPAPTHGKPGTEAVTSGRLLPWTSAFERLNEGCCGGFGYYSCANLLNPNDVCNRCIDGNNYVEATNENTGELSEGEVAYLARQLDKDYLKKHRPTDLGGSFYGESVPTGRKGSTLVWVGASPTKSWGRGVPYGLKTTPETPGHFEAWDAAVLHTLEKMSVREAAKLMDVPQWFTFYGRTAQQMNQVGNGVPVELARAVAKHIAQALKRHAPRTENLQLWTTFCNYAQARAAKHAAQPPMPIYFASGSNHPGEIRGLANIGHAFGVAASECRGPCQDAILATMGEGIPVFVDSGAYSEVEMRNEAWHTVKPLTDADWQRVLGIYDRLSALGGDLYVVAPDKIGDATESLRRLQRYRDRIFALRRRGVNIIVPLQGRDLIAYYDRVVEVFGPYAYEFIPGVPSSKAAVPLGVLAAFVRRRQPGRVHLLGMGPRAQATSADKGKWSRYALGVMRALQEAQPGMQVFLDSVLIRSSRAFKPMRVAQDVAAKQFAEGRFHGYQDMPASLKGQYLPDWTDAAQSPSAWLSPTAIKRVGKEMEEAIGWDRKAWTADPDAYYQQGDPPWFMDQRLALLLDQEWVRAAKGRGGWEVAPKKQLGIEHGVAPVAGKGPGTPY